MISEQFTAHEKRVYRRFCRTLVNLPVYFDSEMVDGEIILLEEEEGALDKAFDDVEAMCREVEDEGDEVLDYDQINVLAMMAVIDVTDMITLDAFSLDGRNFND